MSDLTDALEKTLGGVRFPEHVARKFREVKGVIVLDPPSLKDPQVDVFLNQCTCGGNTVVMTTPARLKKHAQLRTCRECGSVAEDPGKVN